MRGLFLVMLVSQALMAGEVLIALRPSVTINAERATLSEIAELSGDEAIIAIIGGMTVAELPDLRPRLLEADEVRRAIGHDLGSYLKVTGQSQVIRGGHMITEDALVVAAKATVLSDGDAVTISVLRSSGGLTIPAGGSEPNLVATALDQSRVGDIPFKVRVMRGEVELGRALITLRIVRERDMIVAARAIRRGERLGLGDLRTQRRVVSRINAAVLTIDEVVGREARNDIAEDSPLSANSLITPPDVRAGQDVELVVNAERFQLSARGEALNDGMIGQSISVRRAADGRTVRGILIGHARVQLIQ
jgi:flagella basal body P-ring formation protein FlgA